MDMRRYAACRVSWFVLVVFGGASPRAKRESFVSRWYVLRVAGLVQTASAL